MVKKQKTGFVFMYALMFLGMIFGNFTRVVPVNALTPEEEACIDSGGVPDVLGNCKYYSENLPKEPDKFTTTTTATTTTTTTTAELPTKPTQFATNTSNTGDLGPECNAEGGIWDSVYGCRKVKSMTIPVSFDVCKSIPNSEYHIDGTCTFFTYTYLWGGSGDPSGSGSSSYSPGSGSSDGYSRPDHPGRQPTANDNNDPGSSETKTDAGIPAVEGNGYSSTGGVQTEPEAIETTVLDCDGEDGIFCILNTVLTVLTWGVGIAATVGLVLSGIQYASARDNAEQTAKAMKRIVGIVIGLLVYAMMWGLLNWLIPGGLF